MRAGYTVECYPTGLRFGCVTQGQIKGLRSQMAAALARLEDAEHRPCGDACVWCGNCVKRFGGQSTRDVIREMSYGSRLRLRDKLLQIDWPEGIGAGEVGFLGLTFKDAVTVTEAKEALHRFMVAWDRRYPESVLIWVLEFQRRGCPHFHFLFWLKDDRQGFLDWACRTWERVSGRRARAQSVDLSWCYSAKGVLIYMVDMTKDGYQKMPPPGVLPGRFWGYRRLKENSVEPSIVWGYGIYAAAYEFAIYEAFGEDADPDKSTISILFLDAPRETLASAIARPRAPPGHLVG